MLSKHSITNFVRRTRLLNYSIRNCKCLYSTTSQKSDHSDNLNKEPTHPWQPCPESYEVARNRRVKSRIACTSGFEIVSDKNQDSVKITSSLNSEADIDALSYLNVTDVQTPFLEGPTYVRNSFDATVKKLNDIRPVGTPVLALSSSNIVSHQKVPNARFFHSFRHFLFCAKDSVSDPQSSTDTDATNINRELDTETKANYLSHLTPENLELGYMSKIEQTVREKQNSDTSSPYDDGKNPIFPGLPVVKTKGDLTEHENELTEYRPGRQKKYIFPKVYSLAPLVNQSEVLSELVKLGVDLTEIEKKGLANKVIKMDFQRDIKPHLLFFHVIGIPGDEVGKVLSNTPDLLRLDVETLKVRINYFKSKKFTKEDIVRMITKAPSLFLMSTGEIDAKLGFFQKLFKLKGWEVRNMTVTYPKLIVFDEDTIKSSKFRLSKFFGFTELELKKMLLNYPKLYIIKPFSRVEIVFDILYNTIEIPHSLMVSWPEIFNSNINRLHQRHRFLLKVDRAQYDPTKENYVSLKTLIQPTDEDFCVDVAKASVIEFYNFLKTI